MGLTPIHALVADGLFLPSGPFVAKPAGTGIRPLAELFRASILAMLEKQGRLDPALARKIMTWRHNSGFSVHNVVRIGANDAKGRLGPASTSSATPSPWRSCATIPKPAW